MSSNRQIIKQQTELQNEFMSSVANTNKKILSWLQPLKQTGNGNSPLSSNVTAADKQSDQNNSKGTDFFTLPIISGGSGLTLDNESGLQINTIDDHIKNRKTIKYRNDNVHKYDALTAGSNKKANLQIQHNDSDSMKSLKNKLRKENVRKIRQDQYASGFQNNRNFNNNNNNNNSTDNTYNNSNHNNNGKPSHSVRAQKSLGTTNRSIHGAGAGANDDDDDDDSDKELRNQRSAKKKTNVLFGSKVGKKKRK